MGFFKNTDKNEEEKEERSLIELFEGEEIICSIKGLWVESVTLTNFRVIILKANLTGAEVWQTDLKSITTVGVHTRFAHSFFEVASGSNCVKDKEFHPKHEPNCVLVKQDKFKEWGEFVNKIMKQVIEAKK